jgi:hypothetical protein
MRVKVGFVNRVKALAAAYASFMARPRHGQSINGTANADLSHNEASQEDTTCEHKEQVDSGNSSAAGNDSQRLWSVGELALLEELVAAHGTGDWKGKATKLGTQRTALSVKSAWKRLSAKQAQ